MAKDRYYNTDTNDWENQEGEDGATYVIIAGSPAGVDSLLLDKTLSDIIEAGALMVNSGNLSSITDSVSIAEPPTIRADLNFTDEVLAGASKTITVAPPEGYILTPISLNYYMPAPGGAASGTHSIFIFNSIGGTSEGLRVYSQYNATINIDNLNFDGGTSKPASADAFWRMLRQIRVDSAHVLNITYTNNTNVSQTNDTYQSYLHYILRPEAQQP